MKRTVTLDKNSGSKKLRDACNQEEHVRCILLPHDIRDADDRTVLEFGIQNNYLILTFDKPLYSQCSHLLTRGNPGLLLLREDDGTVRHMNTKMAAPFLKKFKEDFPEWHTVGWANSYVEVTPTVVYVYPTSSASPIPAQLNRSESGWQERLKDLLKRNAGSIPSRESKSPITDEPAQ